MVVRTLIEQFPVVARPDRESSAAGGDLPSGGPSGRPARERSHIYLEAARFVGRICDPPSVRREGRISLIKRRPQEELRLARLRVLPVAHVQGQRPEIK